MEVLLGNSSINDYFHDYKGWIFQPAMFDDTGGYPFRRWIQSYVSYMFITYGWGEEHPQFSALFV